MGEAREFKYIGQRTIRPDGPDKVTGRANFGADLTLPGMIWGRILRSPHAHAKILSIDTSKAEALAGVMAVATAADFPAIDAEVVQMGETSADIRDLARNCLAQDKVLYHGHALAAVAATSQTIAEAALSMIEVEYQVLPPVMDVNSAMQDTAPLLHDDQFTQGLPEQPDKPSNIATVMENEEGRH